MNDCLHKIGGYYPRYLRADRPKRSGHLNKLLVNWFLTDTLKSPVTTSVRASAPINKNGNYVIKLVLLYVAAAVFWSDDNEQFALSAASPLNADRLL